MAAVNFCLAIVGTVQVSRIYSYRATLKDSPESALKDMGNELKQQAGAVEAKAEKEMKA